MSFHIHHGPPGSYKSFGVVQDEIIPALEAGRVVVTNIRGLDSIPKIEAALDLELHEDCELINVPNTVDGDEHLRRFFHWLPYKALLVIDEMQRIYPKRVKDLSRLNYLSREEAQSDNRPFDVEAAFSEHRHYGWDIFCTTPNIGKVNTEIREVAQYAYRHQDVTGLLPWYKNKWKEVQHLPSNSGQSESHAIGPFRIRKADTKYFDIYSSVAIDDAEKQVNKTKSIFREKKIIFFMALIVAVIFYQLSYFFLPDSDDEDKPQTDKVVISKALSLSDGPRNPTHISSVSSTADSFVRWVKEQVTEELFFVSDFYVDTGSVFQTSTGLEVHQRVLERHGFEVHRYQECLFLLTHADYEVVLTCSVLSDENREGDGSLAEFGVLSPF